MKAGGFLKKIMFLILFTSFSILYFILLIYSIIKEVFYIKEIEQKNNSITIPQQTDKKFQTEFIDEDETSGCIVWDVKNK